MSTLFTGASKGQIVRAINGGVPQSGPGLQMHGSVLYPRAPRGVRGEFFKCKNTSGVTLHRYDIAGLDSTILDAKQGLRAWQENIGFNVTKPKAPDHFNHWGSILGTIAPGGFGWVQVSGTTVARVNIDDPKHECAGLVDGDQTQLSTWTIALGRIIGKSKDKDGQDWCVYVFGTRFPWVVGCAGSGGGSGF